MGMYYISQTEHEEVDDERHGTTTGERQTLRIE